MRETRARVGGGNYKTKDVLETQTALVNIVQVAFDAIFVSTRRQAVTTSRLVDQSSFEALKETVDGAMRNLQLRARTIVTVQRATRRTKDRGDRNSSPRLRFIPVNLKMIRFISAGRFIARSVESFRSQCAMQLSCFTTAVYIFRRY